MAAILKFKNLFKAPKEHHAPYKYRHFLNSLEPSKQDEILIFSEADHLIPLLPDFKNKKILFLNDQRHSFLFKKLIAREPNHFVNYIYAGDTLQLQSPDYFSLMGDLDKFSFRSQLFDLIICPLSLKTSELNDKLLQRLCQLLTNGGRLIFSVRHPHFDHLLFNQNPAETGSLETSISNYYKLLRKNQLYLEEMSEGVVNLALKPFFTLEGEYDHYHEYKGTPLTFLVKAVKFVRG